MSNKKTFKNIQFNDKDDYHHNFDSEFSNFHDDIDIDFYFENSRKIISSNRKNTEQEFHKIYYLFEDAHFLEKKIFQHEKHLNNEHVLTLNNLYNLIDKKIYNLISLYQYDMESLVEIYNQHPISQTPLFPIDKFFSKNLTTKSNIDIFLDCYHNNPNHPHLSDFLKTNIVAPNFQSVSEHTQFFQTLFNNIDSFELKSILISECPYLLCNRKNNDVLNNMALSDSIIDQYASTLYDISKTFNNYEVTSLVSHLFEQLDINKKSPSDILHLVKTNPRTLGYYLSSHLSSTHELFNEDNSSVFFNVLNHCPFFERYMKDHHWRFAVHKELLPQLIHNCSISLSSAPFFIRKDFDLLLKVQKNTRYLWTGIPLNSDQALILLKESQFYTNLNKTEVAKPLIRKAFSHMEYPETITQSFFPTLNLIQNTLEHAFSTHTPDLQKSSYQFDLIFNLPEQVQHFLFHNRLGDFSTSYFLNASFMKDNSNFDWILENLKQHDVSNFTTATHFFNHHIKNLSEIKKSFEPDFNNLVSIVKLFPLDDWENGFYSDESTHEFKFRNVLSKFKNIPKNITNWDSFASHMQSLYIKEDLISSNQNIPKAKKLKF